MKYKYAFALLSNARAFAESAVEYANKDEQRQWKFAVLHLATAIELLLKAKLAIKDYSLLVGGKTAISITEHQFESGSFKSVTIDECIERLSRVCSFSLSDRQQMVIMRLRNLRNQIAHYIDPTGDALALKAVVAAGLNLFIEINNSEFLDEDPYGAKTMSELIVELYRYDNFVNERLISLNEQLQTSDRPLTHYTDECSDCLQDAAVLIGEKLKCLFCCREMAVPDHAEVISIDGSVGVCPGCNRRSVARHQVCDEIEPTYECFCCGYFKGPEPKWSNGRTPIVRLKSF